MRVAVGCSGDASEPLAGLAVPFENGKAELLEECVRRSPQRGRPLFLILRCCQGGELLDPVRKVELWGSIAAVQQARTEQGLRVVDPSVEKPEKAEVPVCELPRSSSAFM
jgi:hypothetical protein